MLKKRSHKAILACVLVVAVLAEVDPLLSFLKLGEPDFDAEGLRPLYENVTLFGINLYEAGVADKVTAYLRKLVAGPGAVRKTLHETVNK